MSSPIENMKAKRQSIARNAIKSASGLKNVSFLYILLLGIAATSSIAQNNSTDAAAGAKADSSAVASTKADPSAEASAEAEELTRRAIERRAVEAVIWGMPAVNYERMLQAALDNGAKLNQVVYWSRPVNEKNQTLTPNPDTIYLNPFYDTSKGPIVVEIPPADADHVIVGSFDVAWQNALTDVGPAGEDKGKGGKYLILPPDYKEKAPDGYFVLQSETYRGFVILRSNFMSRSDADIKSAVEHGKRVKIYPLGGDPASTVFVDMYDKPFDSTIPYDATFFEHLNRFVQTEPWLPRDRAMIDMLKTIGIEKGKPFKPDEKTMRLLADAAREAHEVIALNYEKNFEEAFFEGARWALPVPPEAMEGMASSFADPNQYAIDGRAITYHMAYFSMRHVGGGQFYLLNISDRDGKPLEGSKTYRLKVPANAPVEQYWSVTAYDRETHALIRGMSRQSLGSNDTKVQKNADGSVDVYFGPKAPTGKESNWVPTDPKGQFELLFRVYGPKKEFFEKKWKLPDVEMVQ
jgi:hypothetical protein